MNKMSKARALAMSAFVCGFITQAADASADALCRAAWPATFQQCQSNVTLLGDNASGSGRTTTTTIRVTANLIKGFTNADAAALDSQGRVICRATDAAPVDTASKSTDCTGIPTVFFLTVR